MSELTDDLAQAKSDLDRFGYCLIAQALTLDRVAVARQRLAEQARAEMQQGLSYHDGGERFLDERGRVGMTPGPNQRLWMLANKGECFRELIVHPLVDELVGHVLGTQFILSTGSANIARPGGARMGLHTDQWWMPQPVRPGTDHVKPADISRQPANQDHGRGIRHGVMPCRSSPAKRYRVHRMNSMRRNRHDVPTILLTPRSSRAR